MGTSSSKHAPPREIREADIESKILPGFDLQIDADPRGDLLDTPGSAPQPDILTPPFEENSSQHDSEESNAVALPEPLVGDVEATSAQSATSAPQCADVSPDTLEPDLCVEGAASPPARPIPLNPFLDTAAQTEPALPCAPEAHPDSIDYSCADGDSSPDLLDSPAGSLSGHAPTTAALDGASSASSPAATLPPPLDPCCADRQPAKGLDRRQMKAAKAAAALAEKQARKSEKAAIEAAKKAAKEAAAADAKEAAEAARRAKLSARELLLELSPGIDELAKEAGLPTTGPGVRPLRSATRGAGEVSALMSENASKLHERGEKLSSLADRTAAMHEEAARFQENCRKLRESQANRKWWQL